MPRRANIPPQKNPRAETMKKFMQRWEALCASSPILRFVDINLRGVGQVMFQDNPLTGLLFLAAIAWGSVAARAPEVFIAGVIAVGHGDARGALAQGRPADAERRSLRIQRRAGRARACDLHYAGSVALGLCRSGRRGLGGRDARNRECAEALRRRGVDVSLRASSPGSCCLRLMASPGSPARACPPPP